MTATQPSMTKSRAPGGGRKSLYPNEQTVPVTVTLLPSQIEELKRLGDGKLSAGIRRMYEMNANPYYVSAEMLGDEATQDDARRMVEILEARGYDVEYGDALGQDEDAILTADWEAGLDIISREKYAA